MSYGVIEIMDKTIILLGKQMSITCFFKQTYVQSFNKLMFFVMQGLKLVGCFDTFKVVNIVTSFVLMVFHPS